MLTHIEMVARIAAGTGLGGLIGYERDLHGKNYVGLRAHIIVAMAAAAFMVVSSQFVYYQAYGDIEQLAVDPSRIASAVVSGIGFLAGGAILRTGITVHGLTTAAGLWLVTAIGLCAGSGMFVESLLTTALGLITLSAFRGFEAKAVKTVHRRVSLTVSEGPEAVKQIVNAVTNLGATVYDVEYKHRVDEHTLKVAFDVKLPASVGVGKLIDDLERLERVLQINVESPK